MGLKKIGGMFFSSSAALTCVICCWVISIVLNGPQFVWADVISSMRAQHDCTMPHVSAKTLNIFYPVKSTVTFFIPLIVTWISYVSIIYRTRKSFKVVSAANALSCQHN